MTTTAIPVIAPVVEGHGEVRAVRNLIQRISAERCARWAEVSPPFRLDSAKMRKPDELAKAIRVQAQRVTTAGGVLVLRDGDDKDADCPVALAESLAPPAGLVSVPVQVVVAFHEYESWFLAAFGSLRSHPSVRDDATAPDEPERRRDAKAQLEEQMNEPYKETLHQAKFSAIMDIAAASSASRSFRRMVHAVEALATP